VSFFILWKKKGGGANNMVKRSFEKKIKNFTRFLGRYLWNCLKKNFGYPNALVTYLSTHLGYQPILHNCMYLYILSRAVQFIGGLFLRLKSFCGKWNTHYHWAKGVVKGSRLATIYSSLWSETNVWMFLYYRTGASLSILVCKTHRCGLPVQVQLETVTYHERDHSTHESTIR